MNVELSAIPSEYDHYYALSDPFATVTEGQAAADSFWLPLCAAFPAAFFAVHYVLGCSAPLMLPSSAARWHFEAVHRG